VGQNLFRRYGSAQKPPPDASRAAGPRVSRTAPLLPYHDEKAKTEKELKGIAAAARRAAEPAKPKAEKKAAPKAEKKADKAAEVEEVETPANVEENVETPVTVEEGTEATVAQDNAEIADAKNASTDAEAHNQETKPADDEQLRTNEELERQ
jgi:hypothetical protein